MADGLVAAGVSFLGLPPLPAVPLPYKDNSAPAPMIAESGALAPAPSKDDFVTGKGPRLLRCKHIHPGWRPTMACVLHFSAPLLQF